MQEDSSKPKESPAPTKSGAATPKSPPAPQSTPPTFGKSAILMLVVSVALYAYQTGLFKQLFQSTPEVEDDPAFQFSKPVTSADKEKQDAVIGAFKHAWGGYEKYAMGSDEYLPLSMRGQNFTDEGSIGYMVIDAMDTMQIMGLNDEFKRARNWLATKHSFDREGRFNTFETTIRVLGGLLSSYHLSNKDPIFLEKAVDLGTRMLGAFDSPSGLPFPMVDLKTGKGLPDKYTPDVISTAEAATLQLEFRYLSSLTDNDEFWEKVEDTMKVIKAARLPSRLAPIYMSAETGKFSFSEIRLGSRGDSYYEYLLKQYLQTANTEPAFLEMYNEAMDSVHKQLIAKALQFNHTFTQEIVPSNEGSETVWRAKPKQDHLVCFLGGNLMLGAVKTGAVDPGSVSKPPKSKQLGEVAKRDWKTGVELIETCMHTHETVIGLPPEIAHFYTQADEKKWKHKKRDFYIKGNDFPGVPAYDARYILRPETVESLFIAFRLTGDPKYREYGWKIFQAIEKHAKVEGGYASIMDVDAVNSVRMDRMETFFLSETLKYLYLLFSDSKTISLDKYVFNTEAHPLPIFNPSRRTGFS